MKKKLLIIPALSFATALSFVGVRSLVGSYATGDGAEVLQEQYQIGQVIDIPTYTFSEGGSSITVDPIVITPSGEANKISTLSIKEYGVYRVQYSTSVSGKTYFHEVSFKVKKDLYSFGNFEKSEVYYDAVPEYAKAYTEAKGAYIKLAKGDKLTIERVYNVSELNGNFISLFITPLNKGEFDFTNIIVELTDVKDPESYVRISTNAYTGGETTWPGVSFMKAGGNRQIMCGYDYDKKKVVNNGIFGTKLSNGFPFHAKRFQGGKGDGSFTYIDPSTLPLQIGMTYSSLEITANGSLCADLDNADYFSSFWGGFPSGQFKISIYGDKFTDNFARFCITDLLGVDDVCDKNAAKGVVPDIQIDTPYVTMPEGVIGSKYPIPEGKAKIGNDYDPVSVKVYYSYSSENRVLIDTNGQYFTPTSSGYYTIVYSYYDEYQESVDKLLWVHVGNSIDEISGTIPNTFVESCNVGDILNLPAPENMTGGSGELSYKITARLGSDTYSVSDNRFQPLYSGDWEIDYTIYDYVGNSKTYTKQLTVNASTTPAFAEVVSTPDSFMSGCEYPIPEVYGYTFTSSSYSKVLCDVEIVDKNGAHMANGNKFTPVVENNNDTFTVNFKLNGTTVYTYEPSAIIPYVDNKLKSVNYFLGSNFTAEAQVSGILMSHTANNSSWKFFNKLIANRFNINIGNYSTLTNYSKMYITLVDTKNPTLTASAIINRGGETTVTVGSKTFPFEYDFTSNDLLSITYNNGAFSINGVKYYVDIDDAGNLFKGFDSDFVELHVSVEGTATTKYYVQMIGGTPFSTVTSDKFVPDYTFVGPYAGKYACGDTYKISRMVYSDVLSPNCTCTMSVKDPNNQFVTSLDGTLLKNIAPDKDYLIKLSTYGSYSFSYNLSDESDFSNGHPNKRTVSFKVLSADYVAPEIKATSSWTKKAKVGDILVAPNISISDNLTTLEDMTIIWSVVNPNGVERIMPEGYNSIKADFAGRYLFKVVAMDEQGNTSYKSFECMVSGR